jgi:hypothetical protein
VHGWVVDAERIGLFSLQLANVCKSPRLETKLTACWQSGLRITKYVAYMYAAIECSVALSNGPRTSSPALLLSLSSSSLRGSSLHRVGREHRSRQNTHQRRPSQGSSSRAGISRNLYCRRMQPHPHLVKRIVGHLTSRCIATDEHSFCPFKHNVVVLQLPLYYLKPVQTGYPTDSDSRLVVRTSLLAALKPQEQQHALPLKPLACRSARQAAHAPLFSVAQFGVVHP